MTPSVLGSVTLCYELIWNQKRRCAGVRLFVEPRNDSAVDAQHLIAAVTELWPQSAPTLLLNVQSPTLLRGLLDHAPARSVWLEIPNQGLSDALFLSRVRQAHQRGLAMVWTGDAGQAPEAASEAFFHKTLRSLTPYDALTALRVSLRQHHDATGGSPQSGTSPIVRGSMYEGLASQALVEHALDRQGVWAVAGWPAEEILHGYRFRQIQPSLKVLRSLAKAIEADESLDALEHHMGEEPLLTYRFLRYANSAHLGARSEVCSVRQGLMVMGYTKLRAWLMEQVPHASSDPNLDPIRFAMVLRARIMERLADAGAEDELRREVFLCGIFSQLDLLVGEPLGSAMHRLPLPARIASAVVGQTGPYAPWLAVAAALESSNTRTIHDVCSAHKVPADEVNRVLLRTLGAL
jgi:hypothetical protein